MHFEIADAANQLTNYMGVTYLLTLIVAFLADTYAGRFTSVVVSATIEFLVSTSHSFSKFPVNTQYTHLLLRLS